MSLFRLKEYIAKSENDDKFVSSEIEKLGKHFPSLAEVVSFIAIILYMTLH